jgi:hypothetical protein
MELCHRSRTKKELEFTRKAKFRRTGPHPGRDPCPGGIRFSLDRHISIQSKKREQGGRTHSRMVSSCRIERAAERGRFSDGMPPTPTHSATNREICMALLSLQYSERLDSEYDRRVLYFTAGDFSARPTDVVLASGRTGKVVRNVQSMLESTTLEAVRLPW